MSPMPAASQSLEELLVAISGCDEVPKARSSEAHPCSAIVGTQDAASFQSPEPWRGHIDSAPILFISSNPSIGRGEDEAFPPEGWSDRQVVNYYQRCFDEDYLSSHRIDTSDQAHFGGNKFWGKLWRWASKIFGRDREQVTPGQDFAITNIVHCKSRDADPARQALEHCLDRWPLEQILKHSAAKVVVVLGNLAKQACSQAWTLDPTQRFHQQVSLSGRKRLVVFLPLHPNHNVIPHITEEQLQKLREFL